MLIGPEQRSVEIVDEAVAIRPDEGHVASGGNEEIDVSWNDEERIKLSQRTGRRTVPQIFIGETHVGGSDDLHALERAGELDKLLQ